MATNRFRVSNAAGYILLEAILALAIFSGIAAYQIRQQRDDLLESAAKAHGQEMLQIATAANRYIFVNQEDLRRGVDIAGFANDLAPTLAEIRAQNLLAPNFGNAPIFGGGYNITLRRVIPLVCDFCTPAQCIATIDQCAVIGLLVTTQPVQIEGQRSAKVIGRAIEELGVNGGATGLGALANDVVAGVNDNWRANVPPAVVAQAGLVGVQLGRPDNLLFNDAYLRRDGSLPMTGALNMGAQDINNATTITGINVNGTNVNADNIAGINVNARTLNVNTIVSSQNLVLDRSERFLPLLGVRLECGPGEVVAGLNWNIAAWLNDYYWAPEFPFLPPDILGVICARVGFS
jgi:hypothetical protein